MLTDIRMRRLLRRRKEARPGTACYEGGAALLSSHSSYHDPCDRKCGGTEEMETGYELRRVFSTLSFFLFLSALSHRRRRPLSALPANFLSRLTSSSFVRSFF